MPPSNERSVAAGSREKGISIERKAPSLLNQVWTEVAAPENLGLLWPAGIAVAAIVFFQSEWGAMLVPVF